LLDSRLSRLDSRLMYDVAIVGGGPAGAAAAHRCARMGLTTLVLEKERLPRDKVCSGWVMGVGRLVIARVFGEIPGEVLTSPPSHQGYICHVPGVGSESVVCESRIAWRRDLDRWLLKKAQEQGAELWEGARLTEMEEGAPCLLRVAKEGVTEEVTARFVIGADGANSHVRKAIFPGLEVPLSQAYQEWFAVDVPLERRFGYLLLAPEIAPFYGAVHYKGEFLVLEIGARMGQVKEVTRWMKGALASEYRFPLETEAAGKGACVEPVLYSLLFSGSFRPARGNALLVGDSAGMPMPVTGEGIGTAMLSGLAAAVAIGRALEKNLKAEALYLQGIRGLLAALEGPYNMVRDIRRQADRGGIALLETTAASWRRTLDLSEAVLAAVDF